MPGESKVSPLAVSAIVLGVGLAGGCAAYHIHHCPSCHAQDRVLYVHNNDLAALVFMIAGACYAGIIISALK